MSPVIRISESTWERLKLWAVPLEDNPEDVINKVLNIAEEHRGRQQALSSKQESKDLERSPKKKDLTKSGRLQSGLKIAQSEYRRPILEALSKLGGQATVDQVLKLVEEELKPNFTEVDYQYNPSGGDVRWRNTAQWERLVMVKEGLLKPNSPRGIWELNK